MLNIRKQQIDILNKNSFKNFIQKLSKKISADWKEKLKNLSDDEVIEEIQYQYKKCTKYGIKSEQDIANYISLSFFGVGILIYQKIIAGQIVSSRMKVLMEN